MENKSVRFNVRSPIVTKARPRARVVKGKFAQVYTPQTTQNYENLIKLSYKDQCGATYFEDKQLYVRIVAYFGKNKELEKYGSETDYLPATIHKDCDNIAKTILDALNGVAYKDDKQVWRLEIEKRYNKSTFDEVDVYISEDGDTLDNIKRRIKEHKERDMLNFLLTKETKLTKAEKERLKKLSEPYVWTEREQEIIKEKLK